MNEAHIVFRFIQHDIGSFIFESTSKAATWLEEQVKLVNYHIFHIYSTSRSHTRLMNHLSVDKKNM